MKAVVFFAHWALTLASISVDAFPHFHSNHHLTKNSILPRVTNSSCQNTATSRSCWGDYNLDTDYYSTVPTTNVTREYWLELVNTTVSPDGFERIALTVNGTIPGPTIEADWGDEVVVHVLNSLENNGSTIHFHGIRQLNNNINDGVPSIVQCPSAPGDSYTYRWKAEQYGTSWYHSHFALQAWDGVFGGIVIHGPSTADYDEDLGNLFLNDWSHQTASSLALSAALNGPPQLTTALINGTNVWDDGGSRFETTFESGKKYLLRLVNGAIDSTFRFSIDNHTLTVISTDFVPIVPYTTDTLNINIGQRYDVVVEASESVADYWLRAIPQTPCSNNGNSDDIKGIIRYDSSSTADPTTTGYSYTNSCNDEDSSNLVPYLAIDVGDEGSEEEFIATVAKNSENLFLWYLNGETFQVEWSDPTLLQIYNGNTSFPNATNLYELPTADIWVYVVIETTFNVPHPIHLHGHDFRILSQGTGTFDASTANLTLTNPPRRDTAMLPLGGHLVVAFKTDNPGAWLMHCHIGWHTAEGFALQWVERASEIFADNTTSVSQLQSTCSAWDAYASAEALVEDDSGV